MTTIKYTIDVPQDLVPELETLMNDNDVYFDSRQQITAINDALMETSTAMGHHAPDLIESLNHHLKARRLGPLVPTDHQSWKLERLQAFLQMTVNNFSGCTTTSNPTGGKTTAKHGRKLSKRTPWSSGRRRRHDRTARSVNHPSRFKHPPNTNPQGHPPSSQHEEDLFRSLLKSLHFIPALLGPWDQRPLPAGHYQHHVAHQEPQDKLQSHQEHEVIENHLPLLAGLPNNPERVLYGEERRVDYEDAKDRKGQDLRQITGQVLMVVGRNTNGADRRQGNKKNV